MQYQEAQQLVSDAGFDAHVTNNTVTTDGLRCGRVASQSPAGGSWLEAGKVVKLVVVDGVCETPTPTASPTTSAK
ncbi:PASTA domain-containing protein [Actinomadura sp. ATCC 31491]|uniref:PASTA domain-containing protein n=2 Tax=Actinomadura luzonensis TaxID=2805427 RepID=A0ABT0FKU0_9ACTN|nr:PASTA domain-containing protein [Actinomadura luzonensis]